MRTLKQNTLIIMAFSILTRILSFIFKIYLSRKVGAEMLGLYQMSVSVFVLFCTISASGIPLILSRKTATLTAQGQEDKVHGVFTGATLFSLGAALLLLLGAILFKDHIGNLFSDERCIKLFYIILPALFSTVLYQLIRGYLMGKKKYVEYSFTELLEELIRIVISVSFLSNAFLLLSKDVALAIAFTVTDYVMLLVLIVLYFIKGGRIRKPEGVAEIIRSSAPITLMRISAGALSSFIAIALPAVLVRNGLTAGEAAAEYGRAVGMAFSLLFAPLSLTGALCVVILPETASLAAKGKWDELRSRVDRSMIFIFAITVLFYALYVVMGECYGELLFGDVKAGRFISFSAGMVIPVALSGLINTTLNSLGEEKKVFTAFALSAVLLIVEILFLPKYLGIYALAVAESSFYLLQFVIGIMLLYKKKACGRTFFRPAVTILLFAFPCIAAMKAADMLVAGKVSLLFRTAFVSMLGGAIYLLLLLILRPIPSIKTLIVRLLPKKRSRGVRALRARHEQALEEGKSN